MYQQQCEKSRGPKKRKLSVKWGEGSMGVGDTFGSLRVLGYVPNAVWKYEGRNEEKNDVRPK